MEEEKKLSTGTVEVVDDEGKDSDIQITTPRGKETGSRASTGMSPEYKKIRVDEDTEPGNREEREEKMKGHSLCR